MDNEGRDWPRMGVNILERGMRRTFQCLVTLKEDGDFDESSDDLVGFEYN